MADEAAAELRERVRARYAEAARQVAASGVACCGGNAAVPGTTGRAAGLAVCGGGGAQDEVFGSGLYPAAERDGLPELVPPGGRVGVTDVVAEDHLAPAERAQRGDHVGCIAGALSFSEYREGLAAAGFRDIEVTPTHEVADAMHSAIIKAVRPA